MPVKKNDKGKKDIQRKTSEEQQKKKALPVKKDDKGEKGLESKSCDETVSSSDQSESVVRPIYNSKVTLNSRYMQELLDEPSVSSEFVKEDEGKEKQFQVIRMK